MPASVEKSLFHVGLFDPDASAHIVYRGLPHWSQSGAITFITFRTHDSMPGSVLDRWHEERRHWLLSHGINPRNPRWQQQVSKLEPSVSIEFNRFRNRWHDLLDAGSGACVLARPEIARIVAESLLHFDGERYLILDFVVMPNHVHLLAAFPGEEAMLAQCASWKKFTASEINRRLGQKGRFWQQDSFDHLIRRQSQFDYLRRYIGGNPAKARLQAGQFIYFSTDRREEPSRGA